jgi:hypothetical protein
LARLYIIKSGYKGRRQAGRDLISASQIPDYLFNPAFNLFGFLGTDPHTLPIGDTTIFNDFGMITDDPDGFDRTVPYAFVTIAATGFNRRDNAQKFHLNSG